MQTDSPDLVIAMRLFDSLKLCGFEFRRSAPDENGPLIGPVERQINGSAIDVLIEVLTWEPR